jgi:hypothetical protein
VFRPRSGRALDTSCRNAAPLSLSPQLLRGAGPVRSKALTLWCSLCRRSFLRDNKIRVVQLMRVNGLARTISGNNLHATTHLSATKMSARENELKSKTNLDLKKLEFEHGEGIVLPFCPEGVRGAGAGCNLTLISGDALQRRPCSLKVFHAPQRTDKLE